MVCEAVSHHGPSRVIALVSLLIVVSTLAFGAVYAWVYLPLFLFVTCLGVGGLVHRGGISHELRRASLAMALVALAIAAQLLPLSPGVLTLVSPRTPAMLARYALGFAATDHHALSIDAQATLRGLGVVVALATYTVGLAGILSRRRIRTLVQCLVAFGVPLALVGMYGREHNNGLVYGFWRPQEDVIADSFGPFVNRNHFAGWMLMTVGLSTGLLCGRIERALKRMGPEVHRRVVWLSSADANVIALVALGLVVMAMSLVWTLSRSGILSFSVAMVCFAWLMARRRDASRTQRALGIAFVSSVLLAGLSWRGLDRVILWFSDTTDLQSRLGAWRDGWQVVRDFPLAGTGINTYRFAMLFYQRHNLEFWMSHAHNDYLQLLAEGGLLVVVPVALAAVLFILTVRRCFRRFPNDSELYWLRAGACVGLLAIALQETAEFSLHIPANMLLFATLAAIAISPIADS